jgi:predicted nucleic acid-binding Zn ribbon protein
MKTRATIDGWEVDAVVSFTPTHEAETTDHPIEDGSDPSDHIRVKPVMLQMEGLQTATPLGADADDLRPLATYQRLVKIQTDRRLVTVKTYLGEFASMALISLSPPQDVNTGEALRFSVTWKQVKQVSTQTVALTPSQVGLTKKQVGKQPPKPASPPDADEGKTRAAALFDLVKGAL